MGFTVHLLVIICFLAWGVTSNCIMEGVDIWQLPITVGIEDYHEGVILDRAIQNIQNFNVAYYDDLNGGPYVSLSIANSRFVISTNEAYRQYEENEMAQSLNFAVTFNCADGTNTLPLTIQIPINDNNNNDPLWKTEGTAASLETTYDFTIATPVAPGFSITDCVRDIIVRDVDLTNYAIEFGIENNPYFEISYDASSSTVDKEYKASLRTNTFIRSIPEPIVLRISATDMDETQDPPITTYTTVTIRGSTEFVLPDEPVFSQPIYIANYNENNQVTLEQTISLQQGYDNQVQFSLEGDYAEDHFDLVVGFNQVSLTVTNPLPNASFRQGQIHLVVKATREYTSGASSTIVVQLPEAQNLEFERAHYEGEIVDNTLQLTQLILSQGYQESTLTVTVEDYPSFFTATTAGNLITLSMTPLDDNIIEENNFINLRVTASSDYSSATTIVTLEIIKDDIETPLFEMPLYTGTYDSITGLTLAPLLLTQGYDETVQVTFSGEHANYFELVPNGPSWVLQVIGGGLPSNILSEQHILLSVEATKPRTVGARTVVSIALPEARQLEFEALTYSGSLQDNILALETIILSVGYDSDVTFTLTGDHSNFFFLTSVLNQVTINPLAQLPEEVISENNFLMFTVTANGLNALPTSTAVLLEIIKDDVTTPVFSQAIYYGNYLGSLDIDMGNINLAQGYDSSVSFRIEGENSQYFQINQNAGNSVTLSVQTAIPEELIFNEKAFVFNIIAVKPLAVNANAAIFIRFSEELTEPTLLQFEKHTYTGSVENQILTLENIVLGVGYAAGTEFHLTGDYSSSFTPTVNNNVISLSLSSELSAEVLENNKFLVLELEARRDRAVPVSASIIIDLIEDEIPIIPVFNQAFYTGVYTEENILQFEETIALLQGYDETVAFSLLGESSEWFTLLQDGNSVTLVSSSNVPQDVLDSYHQLLFTVVATKPNAINGESAISIDLPKEILEPEVLRFAQSSYEGSVNETDLQVPTISLVNEITDYIDVTISGEHAEYFSVSHESNIIYVVLVRNIPSEVISSIEFLLLDISALKQDAVTGHTALILRIDKEPPITTPVFEQAYYNGEYSEESGLLFDHTLRLIQGFDATVSFTLQGDGSEWFILTQTEQNSLTLTTREGGIPQTENINHLIFSVVADKPGSVPGEAAVIIDASDLTETLVLGFEQASYLGTIDNDVATIEPIVLNEGYTNAVSFTINGELSNYFSFVQQGPTVTVVLQTAIPEQSLPANRIVMLELQATAPDAVSATTAVVFEVVLHDITVEELMFSAPYYIGQYSEEGGLVFGTISLDQGYDQNVRFALDGEHAQWFTVEVQGNQVTLTTSGAIPPAVLANNQQLVFVVTAEKPDANIARATIVISLVDDMIDVAILSFERASYLGTIENNAATIEPIVLNEGYTTAVTFTLHGDLSNYFSFVQQGSSVTVVLQTAIPDQSLPANRIVLLELRAAAPDTVSATTAVVFEVVLQGITEEELVFSAPYYTGQYSEAGGLVFGTISLDQGYDQNVQFALDGEHAQWFTLEVQGNQVTLTTSGAIPPAVLANNQQLVFVVTATKPDANIARATIVISLVDDLTNAAVLGFERASYLGTIENNAATIEPIVLNEGYTTAVTFTLHGDLSNYFSFVQQGSSVTVVLQTAIPDQSLSANRIVLLELRAAAPDTVSATTAVVFEVVLQGINVEELVFSAPYYTGQYSEAGGLVFGTISLDQGYDQNVQFALDGEHAQWFTLEVQGNQVTLTTSGAIPPAVLANNQQLVFVVTAMKPDANIARATIVISLVDDLTNAAVLGFERASYLGRIENNAATIEPIVLNEGYTTAVTFTLHGDLSNYFSFVQQGSSVTVVLQTAIPEQSLPANRIVLLELRAAASDTVSATTAVVFEVVLEGITVEELVFSAPYYTGQYSEAGGLVFGTISLNQGYDQNVQFALDGEHAQWFTVEVQGNQVTLTTSGAIPPAVLANNQQLVFVVTATKPDANIARATIIISLVDDLTNTAVLGFERASYLGTIENNAATIEPIVLNEGYTTVVTFTLHGDLSNYFSFVQQGSSVTVVLQTAIPEQSLPANRIVLLELRAAAPDTVSATTAVVFEVVLQGITVEELVFSAPYYTGQYSEAGGLVFGTISLDQGYDQNVQFALDGEHAQWFTLEVQGNQVTLTTSGAIPPAVLANNQQLVFVVTATKPEANIARATIVISLVDDLTNAAVLGFERASYLGTIENNAATIEPIVLNEGYTTAVTFTLHGDLSNYFSFVQQGSSVTVVLQTAIPEQSLPANRIVLLELRAAAPDTVSATTAVVFEIVLQGITVEELVFSAPYYTGQYSEAGGLVFGTISLDQGYDQNVQFALGGEHAQWFTLEVQGNQVTLTTSGAIPPAVLANNQQLVFVVTATKPDANIARATIVISLVDDLTNAAVLGFERASYLGRIENNAATIEPIVLNEGYTTAVTFTLHGDLSNYFSFVQQGSSVTVVLQTAIPEQSLPANRIVLLELRAAAPDTVSATTAVVFEVVLQGITVEELVFSAPYYTGQYSEAGGLVFGTISLDQGYDQNVQLALDGEHAQWFTLEVQGNQVTLTTSGAIPPAVLANNQQLVFVVTATKPDANIARATIVISLVDDLTNAAVLGFERASYLGTIENNAATIEPIVLNEGYTTAVTFTLHGDLSNYFSFVQQGSSVTVVLQTAIPEQSLPANRIVLLELRAAAPDTVSATTAVVFEVVLQGITVEELVFSAPYYTGQYSEAGGLVFGTISLDQGYDQNVQFALDGEHAQWFTLEVQGNQVTLTTSGAIPPAVLANNQQLVFVVTATKPDANIARATIVISLVDDLTNAAVLGFERASYLGTIENNAATIEPIILNEGYTTAVTFTLHGDLSNYFSFVQQGSSVTVVLQTAIPDQSLPANRIVLLELRAAAPDTVSATTAVVFEVVLQGITVEELVFSAPYYTGQYSEAGGLVFGTISLDQGYDQNVQFALDGEHAQWFTLEVQGNQVTLTTSGAIPPAVLANNQQLVFVVTATKPDANIARATIVISLVDDLTNAAVLGFERASYLGTIENNAATIEPIVLNEGYTTAVTFTLHGDLSNYFSFVQQGSSVTVVLQTAIPEQSLPANRIVLLELRAAAPDTVSATTAVVFEVVLQGITVEELVFSAPYYTGQYSEAGGLVFGTISLDQGYDQNVQFALDGEHAQWFTLEVQGNQVTLTTSGAIPPAVLANNQQLVFVVTATKPDANIARTTIVISLVDDLTNAAVLGFERASYLGTIENNAATIEPIVLNEGYTTAVTFTLHGDLSNYFSFVQQGSSVTVVLQTAIPDQSLPANRIVLLELRAAAPDTVSATTAVVFEVVLQGITVEELVFSAPYYTGQYSEAGGLVFGTISLDQGYDQNVQFALDGEHAQWFTLEVQGNQVTLTTSGAIPPAVLANNQQLVFVVTATKPDANIARATIVISLVDDLTNAAVLGFERASYLGTIENNAATIEPIVLNEGYTTAVTFTLHGDLSNYFSFVQQGSSVTVVLQTAIPEQSLPANRIVLLELRAAAPDTVSATTAVVFEVVLQGITVEELVFSAPYYTGQYSEAGGLVFGTISLDQGYDQNIQFALDGEHAQWFTLEVQGNQVTLTTSGAIPPAVLANNQQLVFVVTATKPDANIARATIVISLVDDLTNAAVLGFERASYLGTIENNAATIEPIVLNEGYTTAVTFTLHGDLSNYFSFVQQGSSVTVVLQTAIPDQSLPANRILLLELRAAAPDTVSATTAVVFEVVQQGITVEELMFSAPYYTGQYSEAGGLVFGTISLDQGYDQNVQFALDGEHAQWFTLEVQGNQVTLTTSGAIPPAVLANNQQLVFVVTATKPDANIARATIVISLVDDLTNAAVLGFERASYLGRIENNAATIEPIVLNEGYTTAVTFTLHGDLSNYFSFVQQGSSVTVVLQTAIPEQSLPANRIVLLELRAAAPDTVSATTAVVFEVVLQGITVEELVFSAPYYTGQYSEAGGLVFGTISLDQGYDQNVQFALDGEHAQWFTLEVQGNQVTLTTSGAIPPAVLANNQQLVYVVTATKPDANIARATIVISLVDDLTNAAVLGFERASYLGTIENNAATIEPIVLNEGYTTAVTFTLHGDLSNYFSFLQQGSSVTVVLQTAIPEQSLPANRIVLLELRAAAPDTVSATTAVVFEVVLQGITVEELVFSAPYYTGQYSEAGGLVFGTISLDQGYDQNVQFALDGEHAQWFTLEVQGNQVTLTTSGAIPPAVLANNQQLVFVVTATKPDANIARATIVISLVDDITNAAVLGFERASYLGTIENNAATIEPIVLNEGYTTAVTFTLHGDLSNYFSFVQQGSSVTVVLQTAIPEQSLPANRIVLLELRAAAPDTVSATTAVVFEVVLQGINVEELVFSAPYYTGQYSEAGGLVFGTISLDQGYDQNVQFALDGEHAQWFTLEVQGNQVTLTTSGAIPPAVLANNQQLVFVVTATKPDANIARATIVISLVDDLTNAAVLGFERASYLGTIENNAATIEPIVLNEGYTTAVTFTLHGDLSNYFSFLQQGSSVTVVLQTAIPEQSLPANRIVLLELRAAAPDTVSATTAVVFEVVLQGITVEELVFSAPYYTGQYSEAGGLVFGTISLDQGYDQNVQFALDGENAQWFTLEDQDNQVTLTTSGAIPPAILANNQQLVFVVTATKPEANIARATIVISLVDESESELESFDKLLYVGTINLNVVLHETITVTGYTGNTVEILGDYRYLFVASINEGSVVVVASGTLALPEDVTHVPMELQAGAASAVLLLDVNQSETPELPTVIFGSPSYVMRANMAQTGLIGRVSAAASNGESIAYTLIINNAHLQERISITGEGEIHLSASTNTGVYSFEVIATSVITQVQATAAVQLTVEVAATCGDDDHHLPPLIILNGDEEEPHENLVVLDSTTQAGCTFRLTNSWPPEHDWLYVDANGLHARVIDREDPRIAFMALSQIQVEIVLECPSDTQTRVKRSLNTNSRHEWLGPYGSNRWILTDTILYNSRRSFVNFIVNDINDNYPIFIGYDNEPVVVGYPIPELEDVVLPRALAELKATDADVGENAQLVYWSSEPVLAVAPFTGSVHVRDGATLTDEEVLTVSVTDLNGREEGLTTTMQIMVKLIDVRHIAVVTVRNAFLDHEDMILSNLTAAVGYEVKALSSAVISDDTDTISANARSKQEVTSAGASLQLYVYGLIEREPVAVEQLSTDISENVAAIDVTSTISLEDHLEGREIPVNSGRDTGLLVATIVLSVLLFILIVAIAVWFFLRWRKARNYEEFSDVNSVASRNEPLEEPPKVESLKKPRLNLEELKRSERRLQEMLEAPVENTAVKPSTSAMDPSDTFDTIINMAPPDTPLPIVIQSIDKLKDNATSEDEDEFGERTKKDRRKSVVTFNENVEKIIHVEDIPDDNSSEVEVFKF